MEYGRYMADRWQLFHGAGDRAFDAGQREAAYFLYVASRQFKSDRRYLPHAFTARPAPAPVRAYPWPAGKRAPVSSGLPF